jgi:hypothetical protein
MLIDAAVGGEKGSKRESFTNIYFWVGMIIGVIMSFRWWLALFVRGWTAEGLYYNFTPLGFLPYTPLVFSIDPFYIGSMLLVLTNILQSHILFFIIFYWIIPPVAVFAGVVDKQPAGWEWTSTWWSWIRTSVGPTSHNIFSKERKFCFVA